MPSSAPPTPLPTSQELGSFLVITSFAASGDVSDFDEGTKANILEKLAGLAGFASVPLDSTIEVLAGSVVVVAKFPVVTRAEATAAQSSFASYCGTTGREAFEQAMSLVLAEGVSVTGACSVEVEGPKPPERGGSSAAAIATAAAGVVVVTALLGAGYILLKKKIRRKREQEGASVNYTDAELTMAPKVVTERL